MEKKIEKVIVELNGDRQGNNNGSNLLVMFLDEMAHRLAIFPISIKRWDLMLEDNRKKQWELIEVSI